MSIGELTSNVGDSTTFIGELLVGELTRWRSDGLPKSQKGNIKRIPGYLFDNYFRLKAY